MKLEFPGQTVQAGLPFHTKIPPHEFILRSLDPDNDLPGIHPWLSLPYARSFWDVNLSLVELQGLYRRIQSDHEAHSYLGLVDRDPVCQLDVYRVSGTEIGLHYDSGPGDIGIHLLMCPDRTRIADLTVETIRACLEFLFSLEFVSRVIAEPDCRHRAAQLVVRRAGFVFCKTVQLSEKRASLYCCGRDQFQRHFQAASLKK
jgi:acetyl CoA:N6-hydroxylysine acetyl transferase